MLDSSRMASFIAMDTGYSTLDINTMVLGGHGDTMVPLPRYSTVGGVPITGGRGGVVGTFFGVLLLASLGLLHRIPDSGSCRSI